MIGRTIIPMMLRGYWQQGWDVFRSLTRTVLQPLASAARVTRRGVASTSPLVDPGAPQRRWVGRGSRHIDTVRQVLNVVFAVGQIITTAWVVASGASDSFTSRDPAATTPLVPAGYAFSIWGFIYGATGAYAVYQALPEQRANLLLRRVGWWTAPAFLGTSLWLLAAGRGWFGLTVVIFFAILAALVGALTPFMRVGAPRTPAERYLVVLPVSVYAGWATVATVANVSTALKSYGISNVMLTDATWATIMLLAAGIIGSAVTLASKGNVGYALAVTWALVGIAVANAHTLPMVALAAGSMAVLVALASIRAWARTRRTP